jgi:hypothetical protein
LPATVEALLITPHDDAVGPQIQSAGDIDAEETFMRRTTFLIGMTMAIGIALSSIGHQFHGAGQPPVKVTERLKVDLAGGGEEGCILLAELVWYNTLCITPSEEG